ncbi:MAG: nuclear transport factor 2 family protein [Bacteroidetes bacterium]|jgi:ketosteroid isomerase-like protein|nr:nuclear transport factor 2 family protein [Bacteroidota bacterium]
MKRILIGVIAIISLNLSAQQLKTEIATRNKAKVKQFFQLLEKENITAFVNLFANNGTQINPYASGLFPKGATGREELMAYWSPVPDNFDEMEFQIEEIYAMEDPNIVFVKYKGKIELKNDAGYYENDYYSTFKFNASGLITEYVEIFNPIIAARAFGLIDKIK